jgi:hypothetical protein
MRLMTDYAQLRNLVSAQLKSLAGRTVSQYTCISDIYYYILRLSCKSFFTLITNHLASLVGALRKPNLTSQRRVGHCLTVRLTHDPKVEYCSNPRISLAFLMAYIFLDCKPRYRNTVSMLNNSRVSSPWAHGHATDFRLWYVWVADRGHGRVWGT